MPMISAAMAHLVLSSIMSTDYQTVSNLMAQPLLSETSLELVTTPSESKPLMLSASPLKELSHCKFLKEPQEMQATLVMLAMPVAQEMQEMEEMEMLQVAMVMPLVDQEPLEEIHQTEDHLDLAHQTVELPEEVLQMVEHLEVAPQEAVPLEEMEDFQTLSLIIPQLQLPQDLTMDHPADTQNQTCQLDLLLQSDPTQLQLESKPIKPQEPQPTEIPLPLMILL